MGLRELNIDLTGEHVALWDSAKKFFGEVWRPAAIELDRLADPADVIAEDSVLWDVLRQTYKLGYHRTPFPEEIGGMDLDPLSGVLLSELMGWAAPDIAVSFGCCTTPYAYAMLSPEPEMQELARKFIADEEVTYTGCWAITEPDHGSDWILFDSELAREPACAPQVRAVVDGDHYVINGQKSAWVSNGTFASHAALWLSLDPSRGMEAGGIAVVPLDLPGVTRGKPLNKLGQRALNQGEIFFDNVRIPKSMMITDDPDTFKLLSNTQLAGANGWMGVCFAGCALAALEEALEFARNRVQGGRPICEHQNIKLKLFDMFASVEAARSLARRAALYNRTQIESMQPPAVHYAMAAKVLSTETAFRVASQAVQVFGGYGLSKEYVIEKIFRDARASLIEDGTNEVLSMDAVDRLMQGKTVLTVQEGTAQAAAAAAEAPSWEEMEPMLRPTGVHQGKMVADPDTCDSCGQCLLNCPFRAWEMGEDEVPVMKQEYSCFSCYNCMVACPTDAISIVDTYHVDEGFFATDPLPLPISPPREARDADGNPDEWNEFEQAIFERRSVRNFEPDPVPETLITRVLEAGRFAPSSGNCQPWRFIVVTDKALIQEMNDSVKQVLTMLNTTYRNDAMVKGLIPLYVDSGQSGLFDPRIILGGAGAIAQGNAPAFLDAPVVILVACDQRSIGGAQIQAGICGMNMNLVAKSLGLGSCWVGFSQIIEMFPDLKEKLGLADPWRIDTSMVLGWPSFKQEGIVPREFRPITWFREGAEGPEIEACDAPVLAS
jgi:alkylation response protein AidB-like acyl-CoA dehydrogenase/nitroreductase/NAD-dependent dihydropyrimidine dehydrogenase PreA subunit